MELRQYLVGWSISVIVNHLSLGSSASSNPSTSDVVILCNTHTHTYTHTHRYVVPQVSLVSSLPTYALDHPVIPSKSFFFHQCRQCICSSALTIFDGDIVGAVSFNVGQSAVSTIVAQELNNSRIRKNSQINIK